ncbi:thioredoxin domain-containing protein [Belnapia rosea]|uniref:hypothetical protein n=1 Tax=Belnapia rosea TaxID=938405 RepID=UPI00088829CD|nr:hypothetical protein [Belnapia rosea]SDB70689.1 hypothetical protein SAMN02927895_03844 [Belnapia rosea]
MIADPERTMAGLNSMVHLRADPSITVFVIDLQKVRLFLVRPPRRERNLDECRASSTA